MKKRTLIYSAILATTALAAPAQATGLLNAKANAHAKSSASVGDISQGQNQGQKQGQSQGQVQGQVQGQNQGQGQGQNQSQVDNWSMNQNFESRPSGPSIAAGLAGLPGFSNSGLMNACAGAEAYTFSLGGSVGLAGGQVSGAGGIIGWGDSSVVTIVPCEIRESVVLLGEAGYDKAAVAVACLHPYMKAGLEVQQPGLCGGAVPGALPDVAKAATEIRFTDTVAEQRMAKGCEHGLHPTFNRCFNPDFDT